MAAMATIGRCNALTPATWQGDHFTSWTYFVDHTVRRLASTQILPHDRYFFVGYSDRLVTFRTEILTQLGEVLLSRSEKMLPCADFRDCNNQLKNAHRELRSLDNYVRSLIST